MRTELAGALLVAAVLTACAGRSSDSTDGRSTDSVRSEETRDEIGPRALTTDGSVTMVVDSIDVSGDDILIGLRVVNGSDRFVNVSVETIDDTRYGPLLVLRDDLDNTYESLAIEPAGIDGYEVGRLGFRLHGPLDPDAEEFTVELATNRGPLTTGPVAAPDGDVVRWWREAPPVAFSDVAAGDRDDRTVRVLGIVDRGSHVDVSVQATDASTGFSVPDDASATLTLADGTELASLPLEAPTAEESDEKVTEFTGVLRFVGTLPAGSDPMTLNMAGIDVEIPIDAPPPSTATEPPRADLPGLRDLIDRKLTTEPLPGSSITIGPEG